MWLPPPSFHIGLISPDRSQRRQWSHGMKPNGLSSVLISSHLISQKQLTLPEQWLLLTSYSLGVPPTSLSVPPLSPSQAPPHLEFPTADPRPSHSHCPLPLSPAMSSTHMTLIATSTLVSPKFLSPAKRPSGLQPHLSNDLPNISTWILERHFRFHMSKLATISLHFHLLLHPCSQTLPTTHQMYLLCSCPGTWVWPVHDPVVLLFPSQFYFSPPLPPSPRRRLPQPLAWKTAVAPN